MATMNYNVMHSAESNNHVDIYQVKGDVPQSEINAAVYAVLCVVAEEVLKRSACYVSGERTAAELAGTIGKYAFPVMPLSENEKRLQMAKEVRLEVGTWKCNFPTEDIFKMMTEWEGVMGLTAKQAYRFQCETKEDAPKGMELKAYKRCRGYRPKRVSYADEEKRIAQKTEVIGKMSQDLSSEGMKKALTVLAAEKRLGNIPYYWANIADDVLRRKLWDDFGKKCGMGPMPYCEKDFEYGPEIWKQVDEDYVQVLVAYFNALMESNPAPEWVKTGSYAQFKNQENVLKKYRGKFYVEGLEARMDWQGCIEWHIVIKTDRWKSEQHPVSRMEPWVEPEKPKKKKVSPKSAPRKVKSEERRVKAAIEREESEARFNSPEREQARPQVKNESHPNQSPITPNPSIADQLRARLAVLLAA